MFDGSKKFGYFVILSLIYFQLHEILNIQKMKLTSLSLEMSKCLDRTI